MNRFVHRKLSILFWLITIPLSVIAFAAEEPPEPPKAWGKGDSFTARPATRSVTLTGYTRARRVVDIISEEAGRCVSVTADIGDTISKDGVFAVLDQTFTNLDIDRNQVDQNRLENTIAYHAKEVRRYNELVKRNTAAQSSLDELQNKLDQSRFQLQALKVQEADLKERRKRHIIQVPPGWTVTQREVEAGQWIPVGKHLGRAGDFRTLLVPFSLSPDEFRAIGKLKGATELHFHDDGKEGVTLRAGVERISPAFDPETRKISVDLSVRQGLAEKRGGLRSELTLQIPDNSETVLVPTSAVSERYEEFWLTRENGQQVRVVLLDHGPDNTSRVRSPEVSPGDRFKAHPATTYKTDKTIP